MILPATICMVTAPRVICGAAPIIIACPNSLFPAYRSCGVVFDVNVCFFINYYCVYVL